MRADPRIIEAIRNLYTARDLAARPTLAQGQADDLKVELDGVRVWLSRCGVEDGAQFDNAITIEVRISGRWETVDVYPG
jgi:hypothetical protein